MENKTVEPKHGRWMDSDEAAAIIGVSPVQLRRTIERHAHRLPSGGIVATTDGVRARKFGRRWRVALDPLWHDPLARANGR
jgi:hypothetical protein